MDTIPHVLMGMGFLMIIIGHLWMFTVVFSSEVGCSGLILYLFFPWIWLYQNWEIGKRPFYFSIMGIIVFLIGLSL